MLSIPETLLRQMKRHAENDYPHECCGLLFGPEDSNEVTEISPCQNIQDDLHKQDPAKYPRDSRTAYFIDPKQFLSHQKKLKQKGMSLRVIYHSHIDTEAYFSDEDSKAAAWEGSPVYPAVAYLVFSVKDRRVKEYAIYVWDPKTNTFRERVREAQ